MEPPLGLISLLSYLNREFKEKVHGKILKSRLDFNTYDELNKVIDDYKPDIIGITILNAQYEGAVNIIKHLRKITCLPIVVGGAEITAIESKIFQDTDYAVDISVLGEGEESLVKKPLTTGQSD